MIQQASSKDGSSSKKSPITTRVHDLTTGRPAVGVFILLESYEDTKHDWKTIAEGKTDDDGKANSLLAAGPLKEGLYRLTYDSDAYFGEAGVSNFYSSIPVNFQVDDANATYYISLHFSPYGYSTFGER